MDGAEWQWTIHYYTHPMAMQGPLPVKVQRALERQGFPRPSLHDPIEGNEVSSIAGKDEGNKARKDADPADEPSHQGGGYPKTNGNGTIGQESDEYDHHVARTSEKTQIQSADGDAPCNAQGGSEPDNQGRGNPNTSGAGTTTQELGSHEGGHATKVSKKSTCILARTTSRIREEVDPASEPENQGMGQPENHWRRQA